jgi:hypothetical protein
LSEYRLRKRNRFIRTVAHQFGETLVAAGVKRIYGIVGESLNGLTDAIARQGKSERLHIRHVDAFTRVLRSISGVSRNAEVIQ